MRGQTLLGALTLTRKCGEPVWALRKTYSCGKDEFERHKLKSWRSLEGLLQQYRKTISFCTKEIVGGKKGVELFWNYLHNKIHRSQ